MVQLSNLIERMIDNGAETLALFRAATVGKLCGDHREGKGSNRTIAKPIRGTTRAYDERFAK
jgi:hypothetical protein